MLFGNRRELAFEVEPLEPTWERRSDADLGPWARLSLFVSERCLTEAIEPDTGRVRPFVAVPLLPLAHWFVTNARAIAFEEGPHQFARGRDVALHQTLEQWGQVDTESERQRDAIEDARFAWYERHFLLAGADGSMLPDLALVRADGRLWFSWQAVEFSGVRGLKFTGSGCESASWGEANGVIDEFAGWVAGEARRRGLAAGEFAWASEDRPWSTRLNCSIRDLASLLDPAARGLFEKLEVLDQSPDAAVAYQAARDLDLDAGSDLAAVGRALAHLEDESSTDSRRFRETRNRLAVSAGPRPELQGYDAARQLRHDLGWNGQPVDDGRLASVLDQMGVATSIIASTDCRNFAVVGAREHGSGSMVLLRNQRTEKPWAHRMEQARSLGHLLLDPFTAAGLLGAGSSRAAAGPRRRRSGAFAAELLFPTDGARRLLSGRPVDEETFPALLEEFQVGAQTAAWQLWNRGLIESEEVRDALIADFGWRPTTAQPL